MIDQRELFELATACLDGTASDDQQTRLAELICHDPSAKRQYIQFMADTWILQGLAKQPGGERDEGTGARGEGSAGEETLSGTALAAADFPSPFRIPHSAFRVSALAAVVAFIAIGILAYSFWPGPAELPVAKQTPAAKIANVSDAKWAGASSQAGDTLTTRQQLLLQSGSAEITFNCQARVIVEGPAELTIVDAAACRLSTGRLTAHVPEPAKGFQVHTPSGTVTDLGTEFGVYVDTHAEQQASKEEEQQPGGGPQFDDKQPPVTEVHVFKGKVYVAPADQLAQTPNAPKSEIPNLKSQILSAGQAVTISDNKVQPLPVADPFKFAIDKLQGKSRQVLLLEDFETYDVGNNVQAIGPWTVQSGTRKGQGIRVADAPDLLSQYKTDAGDPYPNLTPSPPTGGRFVFIACASPNRPETFPILAREIDGKLLARNGQVLIEFDILQNSTGPFEPSLALAAKVEHTAGIELGRDAEGKTIEWLPYQCYRLRLLLDVMDGTVRGVRADRLNWRGPQGWVRDLTFEPAAKCDWTTPPRYVIFGFPVVSGTTPGSIFWLDNVRIEVISEK